MNEFYSIADHAARQRSEARKEKQKDRYQELQMEIAPKKRQVHQNFLIMELWVDEKYRDRMQSERVTAPLAGSPIGKGEKESFQDCGQVCKKRDQAKIQSNLNFIVIV